MRFRTDNGQLGGIIGDDFDNNLRTRGGQISAAVWQEMTAVPLVHILEANNSPSRIHYLSLDIEGAEERVLSGFPFDRYTFLALTIERPTPKTNALLSASGYLFVKNFKYDSFYVHSQYPHVSAIRREPFAQIPPKNW